MQHYNMNSSLRLHAANVPETALSKFRALQQNHPGADTAAQRVRAVTISEDVDSGQAESPIEKQNILLRTRQNPLGPATVPLPSESNQPRADLASEMPKLRSPSEVAVEAAMRGLTTLARVVATHRNGAAPAEENVRSGKLAVTEEFAQEAPLPVQPDEATLYQSILQRLEKRVPDLAPGEYEPASGDTHDDSAVSRLADRAEGSTLPRTSTADPDRSKIGLDRLTAGDYRSTASPSRSAVPSGLLGFMRKGLKSGSGE